VTARVVAVLLAWLAAAVLVVAAGGLRVAPPPFPQAVLAGVTAAALLWTWASPAVRAWALTVDPRGLVLYHVTRFVGVYFLVLHARGELPWAFAVPGGWGDILVAAGAVAVAAAAPRSGPGGFWAYGAWNAVGLIDILGVVATAARLALTEPGSMRALTEWPLGLLVTYVVPLIIVSHVVLFARLARSRRAGFGPI
jgi:hypothetical protein